MPPICQQKRRVWHWKPGNQSGEKTICVSSSFSSKSNANNAQINLLLCDDKMTIYLIFEWMEAHFQGNSSDSIHVFIQGKILWNHADKPFTIPWDLYCVTHVHCQVVFFSLSIIFRCCWFLPPLWFLGSRTILVVQMILEDKKLYRQLNASSFDLAIVDLIANECRFLSSNLFSIFWKVIW